MPLSSDFTTWGCTENCRCSYEVQHFRENYNLLILMIPFQVDRVETRNIWRKLDVSVSLSLRQEKVVFFPKSCPTAADLSSWAAKRCTIFSMLSVLTWRTVSSILHGNRRDQRQLSGDPNLGQKHPLFVLSLLSHETRTLASCSSN